MQNVYPGFNGEIFRCTGLPYQILCQSYGDWHCIQWDIFHICSVSWIRFVDCAQGNKSFKGF